MIQEEHRRGRRQGIHQSTEYVNLYEDILTLRNEFFINLPLN